MIMENKLNKAKEIALLNLYSSYLVEAGLDARVLPTQDPDSLDLMQVRLIDDKNLNILFVPLGEENFKTLSIIQFFVQWDHVERTEIDALRLINAINQKVPLAKLSLNSELLLEYHYYIPAPLVTPFTKEELIERLSLVLSQLEVIHEIWLKNDPVSQLIEKLNQG
jgi:hypothetical protein